MECPNERWTRFQHGGLYTNTFVVDQGEPHARRSQALGPAAQLHGIEDIMGATLRLKAVLDTTQSTRTELHIQSKPASDPEGVDFRAGFPGRVSAHAPGTTSKTGLASPYQTPLRQPKQPFLTGVRKQSIPGDDCLDTFNFSNYLREDLLDQHPFSDTKFYMETVPNLSSDISHEDLEFPAHFSVPSHLGNTSHGNLQSPIHRKDIPLPAPNQHTSVGAMFSPDSVPLTPSDQIRCRDRHATTAGPPQHTPVLQSQTKSGRPRRRRARKACNLCHEKKIRCIRKGEEECNQCRKRKIRCVRKGEEECPNLLNQDISKLERNAASYWRIYGDTVIIRG